MAEIAHYLGTTFSVRVEAQPTPETAGLYPDLTVADLRAELRRPGDYKLTGVPIAIQALSPSSFELSIPVASQTAILPGVWALQVWASEENPSDPSQPLVRAFSPIEIEFRQGPSPSNPPDPPVPPLSPS